MNSIPKPLPGHFAEFYGGYINQVIDDDVRLLLKKSEFAVPAFLYEIPDNKWDYRYGEGKWSIAEVIMHLIDAEQVFCYRAMRIARGDKTPMAGFDQNIYVENCRVQDRSKASVIEEFHTTRHATNCLIQGLNSDVAHNLGNASGYDVSFAALCFIIAGHECHHVNIIKERYL